MDPLLQDLIEHLNVLSDRFEELREGIRKAVLVAELDPEMALTRARKVLEFVVRDVYERRVLEPPGTRPLENLLQRLVKDGHFPERLDAYANTVRKLGNIGTHNFGEKISVADVYSSLTQLLPILEWYFEEERPDAGLHFHFPAPTRISTVPAGSSSATAAIAHVAVVPKGLRAFGVQDSDFFLQLLPGARDKDGLPESIRFWKHRIETTDELTFTIGVIYGPSGCGKSSLVNAGLLPRLSQKVAAVSVEATADDETETRLIKALRKRFPDLGDGLDLAGTIAQLRVRREADPRRQKVLLVIDQFEQWLHARCAEEAGLIAALRQCDGEHVQCLLLVRDDFWVALTRFMSDLHIGLVQGQNAALVDLFDPIHAKRVLTELGRAFGRLDARAVALSKEQDTFLNQAVAGLAQNGRVVPVRLALFAEMVKGRPWTPATLREVGGTEGVGVAFLEETFRSPALKRHQEAAQAVLEALLPETGSDIKGQMRSYDELLDAADYGARPREFQDLVRVLDAELRLITPSDAVGHESSGAELRYFQLTHDFLVPSLRAWLSHKQRETRRGRAEICLADCAALWIAKPEDRYLPSAWEWASIRLLTEPTQWTDPQRRMMQRATRTHIRRGAMAVLFMLALGATVWAARQRYNESQEATYASGLVQRLLDADIAQVPGVIAAMDGYRKWTEPALLRIVRENSDGAPAKLRASLALLPSDPRQTDYLLERLLEAPLNELLVIHSVLRKHGAGQTERLWAVLADAQQPASRRFNAACALARDEAASADARWRELGPFITEQLLASVAMNLNQYALLVDVFRPVRQALLGPLATAFASTERLQAARAIAFSFLTEYAADKPGTMVALLVDSDRAQFDKLYALLARSREAAIAQLVAEIARPTSPQGGVNERDRQARTRAIAAMVLLRMGRSDELWKMLEYSPDPSARSELINGLAELRSDPHALLVELQALGRTATHGSSPRRVGEVLFDPNASIRRALILALASYDPAQLASADRKTFVALLAESYEQDPDPGIHGAAEWALRKWREDAATIKVSLPTESQRTNRRWYVNSQGQTMIIVDGPVEFTMGSPPDEPGRVSQDEPQHRQAIDHTFAIAAKEVTIQEYGRFVKEFARYATDHGGENNASPRFPELSVTWYEAAAYCNWLSLREGMSEAECCYEPNTDGLYAEGMKIRPNAQTLPGYRLPTDAEWEYACRAGSVTAYYFGDSIRLLHRYASYAREPYNAMRPVGQFLPNDLGLFDMSGNAREWVQTRYVEVHAGTSDPDAEGEIVTGKDYRILRGGSAYHDEGALRSAFRKHNPPSDEDNGFRIARTLPAARERH